MTFLAEDWTIVLFATAGVGDFVENAIRGIERCGIHPALVHVVFPSNAKSELVDLTRRFGATPRVLEELIGPADVRKMPDQYINYGTPEFNRLMSVRFRIIRAMLREGRRIVAADIDVAWLRNPLPYLSAVSSRYPWACQTEASADFPPNFCVGFFALHPAPECLELIDTHIARFTADGKHPAMTIQQLFNQIIRENARYIPFIFPLPEALFANGLLYSSIGAKDNPDPVDMVARLQPFIFHSNFTIGLENKRRLLQHVGGWLV